MTIRDLKHPKSYRIRFSPHPTLSESFVTTPPGRLPYELRFIMIFQQRYNKALASPLLATLGWIIEWVNEFAFFPSVLMPCSIKTPICTFLF